MGFNTIRYFINFILVCYGFKVAAWSLFDLELLLGKTPYKNKYTTHPIEYHNTGEGTVLYLLL